MSCDNVDWAKLTDDERPKGGCYKHGYSLLGSIITLSGTLLHVTPISAHNSAIISQNNRISIKLNVKNGFIIMLQVP
jgi:hypothetical protein